VSVVEKSAEGVSFARLVVGTFSNIGKMRRNPTNGNGLRRPRAMGRAVR